MVRVCESPSRRGVPSRIWMARSTEGCFRYVTRPSPFPVPSSSLRNPGPPSPPRQPAQIRKHCPPQAMRQTCMAHCLLTVLDKLNCALHGCRKPHPQALKSFEGGEGGGGGVMHIFTTSEVRSDALRGSTDLLWQSAKGSRHIGCLSRAAGCGATGKRGKHGMWRDGPGGGGRALVDLDARAALVVQLDDAAFRERGHHLCFCRVCGQARHVHAAVLLELEPLCLRTPHHAPPPRRVPQGLVLIQ